MRFARPAHLHPFCGFRLDGLGSWPRLRIFRGVPEEASRAPNYVPASALLEDVFHFDAELFGMSRMEACVVDPQHRQLLVGAWEAAESSGYLNDPQDGSCTAYYCGVAMATYYHNMLAGPPVPNQHRNVSELHGCSLTTKVRGAERL